MSSVEYIEQEFKKQHGAEVSREANVVRQLCKKIELAGKVSKDCPLVAVQSFVRQRLFIRLKYMNQTMSATSRKRPHEERAKSKISKKLKKLIN